MARPRSISDATIIEAAREVFVEQGMSGTTAEIARRAGISEGSIFNRFGSKPELFRRAMRVELDEVTWVAGLQAQVGVGDLREGMVALGLRGIDFFRTIVPLMMMSWSNSAALEKCGVSAGPGNTPLKLTRMLAGFFEAEMRLGRLRRVDAEILARAFLAGIVNYAMFEMLQKKTGQLPLPPGMYMRGLVDVLWNGVAPEAD